MRLGGVNWSVAWILYGRAVSSQCANTNRLVGTGTLNNIIHNSKNRRDKMYSNVTVERQRIINVSLYYVILSSLLKPGDNTAAALFMLGRCVCFAQSRGH